MYEDYGEDNPLFNPMHIEDFLDEEKCRQRGAPHLYALAKSNFRQQNMAALRPVPTLCYSISVFVLIAAAAFAFGIPILGTSMLKIVMSGDIVEIKERYDNKCAIDDQSCVITINIDKKMEGTVHLYYELHSFFQNNRLYMKSINRKQLKGKSISSSTADSDCDPVAFIGSFTYGPAKKFAEERPNTRGQVAYPCGLVAQSFFNGIESGKVKDRFAVRTKSGIPVRVDETRIAWSNDVNRFKNYGAPGNWQDMSDGTPALYSRALHRLDAHVRHARFQKALGPHCARPRAWRIRDSNRKLLCCFAVFRKEVRGAQHDECFWREALFAWRAIGGNRRAGSCAVRGVFDWV
eukprot:TRINITY_DN9761_c0_g1_i7.p1 TRINITY_DN9761_c0_g1~~TRINITY_DN9761_c0_g1_i7.p1  ORF type:complete len:349 (+),score=32.87 TRINITY_DN9761_c0_g1_i7:184-1230(+)